MGCKCGRRILIADRNSVKKNCEHKAYSERIIIVWRTSVGEISIRYNTSSLVGQAFSIFTRASEKPVFFYK